MWLKQYLTFGKDRPLLTWLADDLFARNPTKSCKIKDQRLRVNPFLQTWEPSIRRNALPPELTGMVKVARQHGLRLEALAPSRRIIRDLPMWESPVADTSKLRTLASRSRATSCLRETHKLVTVGDFEAMAALRSEPTHDRTRGAMCECDGCAGYRQQLGCQNPEACALRAEHFLNTLQPRWDPRGEHPEDYEEEVWCAIPEEERAAYFDRRVTTYGQTSDALRIFTDPEACPSAERLDMSVVDTDPEIVVAVAGRCEMEGQVSAEASFGVYESCDSAINTAGLVPEHDRQDCSTATVYALADVALRANDQAPL
ncbi:hypothetical protein C8Q76DRAFT_573298, partial [Earliella scabrosa]